MTIAAAYKPRDSYIDNLKVILITLVIVAHFAEIYSRIRSMDGLFNALTSFVMPVFIFITGYLSKGIDRQRKSDLIKVLLPYFLLQLYHLIFTSATGLGSGHFNFAIPTFQNWYLLALFIWRLLIPYYNFFNRTSAIIMSFAVSLGIGFIPQFNKFLALHRAIYFMAFFVLGYFSPNIRKLVPKFTKYRFRAFVLFLVLLSLIFIVSYFDSDVGAIITYAFNPIFGYHDMKQYPAASFYPFLVRVLGLLTSMVISVCFMFAVPREKTWFSKYGRNTLYVYLFHMFIVWPIATISYMPVLTEVLAMILSIIISYFLSQDHVVRVLRPLTDPRHLFVERKSRVKG